MRLLLLEKVVEFFMREDYKSEVTFFSKVECMPTIS